MEFRCDERNNYSLLPVTALQFCCVSGGEVLLEGEGPKLKVFSKEGSLLCEDEVLPFNTVHGIQVGNDLLFRGCKRKDTSAMSLLSSSTSAQFLVFGQKSFRLVQIAKEDNKFLLCCLSEVLHMFDWILASTLLSYNDSKDFKVALVTAHNALIVYSANSDGINCPTYQCEVNCILYSAQVVLDSAGDLVVVSGTVFNQVLVWYVSLSSGDSPCEGGAVQVRLAISGHNGAIFAVRLSVDEDRIVSVSDDRTIRVWNLPSHWKTLLRSETLKCSLVLYGHTARVWDARMLCNHIVSIGEDATCRVWNYDGQCLSVIEGHKGRSVWSLAIDSDQQIVATGGGDCSIRTFHLASLGETSESSLETLLPAKQVKNSDMPRSVLLYKNAVFCLTNNGYLYAASIHDDVFEHTLNFNNPKSSIWTQVHFDPEYSSYCVASLSPVESGWLALGNLHGYIKLMKLAATDEVITYLVFEAHKGKVFSLNWTHDISRDGPNQLLFSCGPDGEVTCWQVTMANEVVKVAKMASFILPPSKHRWLSAVLVIQGDCVHGHTVSDVAVASLCDSDQTIICGDRKGSLHIFKCTLSCSTLCNDDRSENVISPLQSLRVHGPNGVTFITLHKGYVYSAGRDGNCKQYRVSKDGTLSEVRKFKPVKGMDWIEELMFTSDDLLVLGFQATNLVVFSTRQNKHIVCTNCGGGHRSYGFSSQCDMMSSQRAFMVYIKQSTVHMKRFNLDSYFTRVVFQPPFAGREAISLVVINFNSESSLLAVGSEDCNIYIVKLHPQLPIPIRVMKSLQCHISSVRALSCSQSFIDGRGHLLFSGGARASLKTWSLLLEGNDDVIVSLEVEKFLQELDTKTKKVKKPKPKFSFDSDAPPEFRVMSLASFPLASVVSPNCNSSCHYVAAGCSDAQIRQYIYNEKERKFVTLSTIKFHNKCVLKVIHHLLTCPAEHQQENVASVNRPLHCTAVLCSSATDGTVSLWDLQSSLSSWVHNESNIEPSALEGGILRDHPQISSEDPMILIQPHQSGVNDIAVCCNGYDEEAESYPINIATVGDDNALVLTRLKMVPAVGQDMTATMVHQCTQFRAHASSITGVQFIQSNRLLTTSVDQRINLWIIDSSNSLILTSTYIHDVADVSSLCTCYIRSHVYAVFCGIGVQCYRFQQGLED